MNGTEQAAGGKGSWDVWWGYPEGDSHTDQIGVYTRPNAVTEEPRWKLCPQIQFTRRAQRMQEVQGRVLGTLRAVRSVMAAKSLQQGL